MNSNIILLAASLIFFTLLFGCAQQNTASGATTMQDKLDPIINSPRYSHANWGILVSDLNTNGTLFSMNEKKMFAPASTTKLFSSAAVLDAYGADYVFETPVYAKGAVTNGTLEGDLILVASGDVNMGGRTNASNQAAFTKQDHGDANAIGDGILTDTDPLSGLDSLAKQVAQSGISEVNGDVLIDDRLFETGFSPAFPNQDHVLAPIAVNDNLIDVTVTPGTGGSAASVDWRPKTSYYTVSSEVKTIPSGGESALEVKEESPGKLVVRGEIAEGSKPLLRTFQVTKPADFARTLFIEALKREGVSVFAPTVSENNASALPSGYSGEKRVALLTSLPLSEEIKVALKVSQNFHADTYPMLLAAKNGKRSIYEGLAFQKPFFQKAGIDLNSISFGDGQGGVSADMTTPEAAVSLLGYMHSRSDFSAYKSALPIIGVDGTLADAVGKDSPILGKVFAKTGGSATYDYVNSRLFISSRALAGYMTTASGKDVAFAIYVNNLPANSIDDLAAVMEDIGRMLEIIHANN